MTKASTRARAPAKNTATSTARGSRPASKSLASRASKVTIAKRTNGAAAAATVDPLTSSTALRAAGADQAAVHAERIEQSAAAHSDGLGRVTDVVEAKRNGADHSRSIAAAAAAAAAPVDARLAACRRAIAKLPYERVALVLQGGGALGSYQAGVYEGLAEVGLHPDWVGGISIGALNSAIIAGNPPEKRVERLRGFWQTICRPGFSYGSTEFVQGIVERLDGELRRMANGFEAWRAIVEGQRGFFYPRALPPLPGSRSEPDQLSYYDTTALKETLLQFADFKRINAGKTRVSVSAVDVANGNVRVFDSKYDTLLPEHFMASGALPPGFPAIKIDGRYYWDGGLVTNTPLYPVLLEQPRADTLVLQVDLFSASGVLPGDMAEVEARRKDIVFSSRTRNATQQMNEATNTRRIIRELLQRIPPDQRDNAWCREAAKLTERKQYNIIQLIYRSKSFEGESKDYEFSPVTMRDHWASGLADFRRTSEHPEWFDLPPQEIEYVTHDIHRGNGRAEKLR